MVIETVFSYAFGHHEYPPMLRIWTITATSWMKFMFQKKIGWKQSMGALCGLHEYQIWHRTMSWCLSLGTSISDIQGKSSIHVPWLHQMTVIQISPHTASSETKFMFLRNIPWKPPESHILMISIGSRKRLWHPMDYTMLRIDRLQCNPGSKFMFLIKIAWMQSMGALCGLREY